MKVTQLKKLDEKYTQWDISTSSENFYAKMGDTWVLVHNSPAIFLFRDPADGQVAIAKKSLFNKTPKFYKTHAEIDADLSGELADKFHIALTYLPELNIPKDGFFQGDLMFTDGDLKTENIDGKTMIVMHPNTIAYAVEKSSELGHRISSAKVGIVFHTTYTGKSIGDMKASFGKPIVSKLSTSKNVWAIDATLPDDTSVFALDHTEAIQVDFLLKDIGIQFQRLKATLLNHIRSDETLKMFVLTFMNSKVRSNTKFNDGAQVATEFKQYVEDKYDKEIASKKTDKSKSALLDKKNAALKFFHTHTAKELESFFDLALSIGGLKDLLVNKIKTIEGISHYIKTKDGYKVTNPEGFVSINSKDGKTTKLVDRFVFSTSNFSPDVLKGWSK